MLSLSSVAAAVTERILHPFGRRSNEPEVSLPAVSAAKMDRALEVLHQQCRESGFVEKKGEYTGYIVVLNMPDNGYGHPRIDPYAVKGWTEARSKGKPPAEGVEDRRFYDFILVARPDKAMVLPSEVDVIVGNKEWRVGTMLARYQTTLDRLLAERPDVKTRYTIMNELPVFDRASILKALGVTTANRPAHEVNGRELRFGHGEI